MRIRIWICNPAVNFSKHGFYPDSFPEEVSTYELDDKEKIPKKY
jgi:hypothetical protein